MGLKFWVKLGYPRSHTQIWLESPWDGLARTDLAQARAARCAKKFPF